MGCLQENTIQALVEGAVSLDEAHALERHLDGCAACRQRLGGISRALVSSGVRPAQPPESGRTLAEGAFVGRYRVIAALGCGATGVVYAAYDPVLDRKVALKLVRTDSGGAAT